MRPRGHVEQLIFFLSLTVAEVWGCRIGKMDTLWKQLDQKMQKIFLKSIYEGK